MDMQVLADLAARSMTRAELSAHGFVDMHAFADLHEFGYSGRYWLRPGDLAIVVTFYPRMKADKGRLPWVAIMTYADQAAFHRAIGATVVGPREEYRDERGTLWGWLERESA